MQPNMGQKRKQYHEESEGGRSFNKRPRAGDSYGGTHQFSNTTNMPNLEASNRVKKRARTIERRLRKPDFLNASVQRELERELTALNHQIEERQQKRLRAHMISKYHMLRFFERKKAERLVKQLTRRLDEVKEPAERKRTEDDLAIAKVDALYTKYFPFMEPYVSLYPQNGKKDNNHEIDGPDAKAAARKAGRANNAKDKKKRPEINDEREKQFGKDWLQSSAAQALRAPRPPMWDVIKRTEEEGGVSALYMLRDRPRAKTQNEADAADATSVPTSTHAKKDESALKDKGGRKKAAVALNNRETPHGEGRGASSDEEGFFEDA